MTAQRTPGGAYHAVRRAAKPHRCGCCGQHIDPGDRHTESVVFPGCDLADMIGVRSRPYRSRYCPRCEPIPDPRLTPYDVPLPGT